MIVLGLDTATTATVAGVLDASGTVFEVRDDPEPGVQQYERNGRELTVTECPRVMLGPMLARLAPREVLVSRGGEEDELREVVGEAGAVATPLARASFEFRTRRGAGRAASQGAGARRVRGVRARRGRRRSGRSSTIWS